HLAEDASGRLATDQAVPFQVAASGVVPLWLFFAEPPASTWPLCSTSTLVRLPPAGSTGCAGTVQPAAGVQCRTEVFPGLIPGPEVKPDGLPVTAQMLLAETALTPVMKPVRPEGMVVAVHLCPLKWA